MSNPTGRKILGGALTPTYLTGIEDDLRGWLFGLLNITEDGELCVTETERENDVSVVYVENTIAASKYVLMIDRDGANWPHTLQGEPSNRVDLTKLFINIDATVNGAGRFRMGVITRIDGINGDISYFCDFPFIATTTQLSIEFSGTPSQVKTDVVDGVTRHFLSNSVETNVVGINTATALGSPDGNVIPNVGDIVIKFENSAGNYNVYVFAFYHTH